MNQYENYVVLIFGLSDAFTAISLANFRRFILLYNYNIFLLYAQIPNLDSFYSSLLAQIIRLILVPKKLIL